MTPPDPLFFLSRGAESVLKRSHQPRSHLVLVEFQYTTCLLATAAEMMLKRKIVALQVGSAPVSDSIGEPMLRGRGPRNGEAPAGRRGGSGVPIR